MQSHKIADTIRYQKCLKVLLWLERVASDTGSFSMEGGGFVTVDTSMDNVKAELVYA